MSTQKTTTPPVTPELPKGFTIPVDEKTLCPLNPAFPILIDVMRQAGFKIDDASIAKAVAKAQDVFVPVKSENRTSPTLTLPTTVKTSDANHADRDVAFTPALARELYTLLAGDNAIDRNALALLVLQTHGLLPSEFLFAETKKAKTPADKLWARRDELVNAGFDAFAKALDDVTGVPALPSGRVYQMPSAEGVRAFQVSKAYRVDGSKDCIAFDNLLSVMERAYTYAAGALGGEPKRIVTDGASLEGFRSCLPPSARVRFHGVPVVYEDYMADEYPGQMHFYNAAGEVVAVVHGIN